jgi:hypothetical protein
VCCEPKVFEPRTAVMLCSRNCFRRVDRVPMSRSDAGHGLEGAIRPTLVAVTLACQNSSMASEDGLFDRWWAPTAIEIELDPISGAALKHAHDRV